MDKENFILDIMDKYENNQTAWIRWPITEINIGITAQVYILISTYFYQKWNFLKLTWAIIVYISKAINKKKLYFIYYILVSQII